MNNKFIPVSYEEFSNALKKAKASLSAISAWRIPVYDAEHFKQIDARCYVTELGSVAAVANDGEIISLCRHNDDDMIRGWELVEFTKEIGGQHLSCYAGLEGLYLRCGFEEVNRIRWDDRYAPEDWRPEFGKEDLILFELQRDEVAREREIAMYQKPEKQTEVQRQQTDQELSYEPLIHNYIRALCDEAKSVERFTKGLKQLEDGLAAYGIALENIKIPEDLIQNVLSKTQSLRDGKTMKEQENNNLNWDFEHSGR